MSRLLRHLRAHLVAALMGVGLVAPAHAVLEFEPGTCFWSTLRYPDHLYLDYAGGPSMPRRAADLVQWAELLDTDLLAGDDPQGPTLNSGVSHCVLPFRTYGALITHEFSAAGRIFAAFADEPGAYLSMFLDLSSRILDSAGNVLSSFEQRYDIQPGPGDAGVVDLDVDYSPAGRLLYPHAVPPPKPEDYPFGPRFFLDSTIAWGYVYSSGYLFFDFAGAFRGETGDGLVRASISEFPYYVPEPGVIGLLAAGVAVLLMAGARARAGR